MSRAQTCRNIVGAASSFCVLRRQYSEWNVVACPMQHVYRAQAIHSVVFCDYRRILFQRQAAKFRASFRLEIFSSVLIDEEKGVDGEKHIGRHAI